MVIDLILKSPVIAALVVGLFSLLAVSVGLRRFKSERWWERKAAAYASAIEALHVMEAMAKELGEAALQQIDLPPERIEKIRIANLQAKSEIRKLANVGGFVMTEQAARVLSVLDEKLSSLGRNAPDFEYYEARSALIAEALIVIKIAAKGDLRT